MQVATLFAFVLYPESTPIVEAHRASLDLAAAGIVLGQSVLTQADVDIDKDAGLNTYVVLTADSNLRLLAAAMEEARRRPADQAVLVCLSGRGDKDLATVLAALGKGGEA